MKIFPHPAHNILLGVAIGDALGVPVEFFSRSDLRRDPVMEMRGYGSHHQPPGTWSDDTALTLCLAEQLVEGVDLSRIARAFRRWYEEGYWTPRGEVFDIGISTLEAIRRLRVEGMVPEFAGNFEVDSNGNGSLMRILPIVLYLPGQSSAERYQTVRALSSITHAHFRSCFSCFIYTELALEILNGKSKTEAFLAMSKQVSSFLAKNSFEPAEVVLFNSVLDPAFPSKKEQKIQSSGYVLHTLEASIWCWLNTESYVEAVLKAVNLGGDTDTSGAVTGGLAALQYGIGEVPPAWLEVLARKEDIIRLADQLAEVYPLS